MKKLMLLAAAALSVSVAQAITLTYTESCAVGTSGVWGGTNQLVSLAPASGSHTVALVYNLSNAASTSTGTLFTYKTGSSSSNAITIGVSNGYYTVSTSNFSSITASTSATDIAVDTSANTILGISIYRSGNSNSSNKIIVTVNGSVLFESESGVSYRSGYYGILDVGSADLFDSSSVIAYTGTGTDNVVTDAATAAATIATAVPEPTCLALLALGVAGLALRRKA